MVVIRIENKFKFRVSIILGLLRKIKLMVARRRRRTEFCVYTIIRKSGHKDVLSAIQYLAQ